MPEGHVTHGLARDHKRVLGGQVVRASSPQGRFAAGAAQIEGRTLAGTDAIGKHLFHRYAIEGAPDVWLHVHLGLYGKFTTGFGEPPEPVGQLRLRLQGERADLARARAKDNPNPATDDLDTAANDSADYDAADNDPAASDAAVDDTEGNELVWLDLRGPTVCELLERDQVRAIADRLGPDPLRRGADAGRAWQRIHRSRTPIGALLMDQSVLAGVGNAFRAEVLFRHGIDPHLPGRELDEATWLAMWTDLVALMRTALRVGRIVTTDPADRGRRRATPETAFYVYRRAGQECRRCSSIVLTETFSGRNLFWCPTCQPGWPESR